MHFNRILPHWLQALLLLCPWLAYPVLFLPMGFGHIARLTWGAWFLAASYGLSWLPQQYAGTAIHLPALAPTRMTMMRVSAAKVAQAPLPGGTQVRTAWPNPLRRKPCRPRWKPPRRRLLLLLRPRLKR
jgi:hypothetical protein